MDQQIELGRGQMRLDPLAPDPPFGPVDLQIPDNDGLPVRLARPLRPAQQGVDPGRQFAHRKRLGQVVVRPDGQAHQQVGLVAPGGEHEDGHGALGLQAPADLQAVEAGQHDVQDHQIRPVRAGAGDRGRTVVRHLDPEPLGPQPRRDRLGDAPLVLNDQDAPLTARHTGQGIGQA
jgi:hypothetical protein